MGFNLINGRINLRYQKLNKAYILHFAAHSTGWTHIPKTFDYAQIPNQIPIIKRAIFISTNREGIYKPSTTTKLDIQIRRHWVHKVGRCNIVWTSNMFGF